jgi:hypothetical protein
MATGTPLLIKTVPSWNVREVGGAMPSVKSSRNELNACPPVTETNDAVNVLLKPNEKVEGVSVVPPSMPLAVARTAAVGLGSPGNSRKICAPHDTSPRLPSVDEKPSPRPRKVMFTAVPVVKLVTVEQLDDTVQPSVMSGNDWKP